EIDARLPFPERFDVPIETAGAVARTHGEKGRVIAAGTTVVRALEGCAAIHGGDIVAGEGTTDLHITGAYRPRVVDGVLTGLHEVGSSHLQVLEAFAPSQLLASALAHADARGYVGHEFGDACLVLANGTVADDGLHRTAECSPLDPLRS
ncbi:MAG: S-adenosylmethionine:tRNA ribosyltransferase-isomerase, partial [Myxococcota bacterium]|nr:S-adenosylmethionine:tRNA ribosyltransferase-isomerase [Myxococcota bacterium]